MKKILFILFFWLLTAFALTAQTSIDSLVFKKINQYRSSLNLSELRWNDTIYNGAKHHTDYEYFSNKKKIDEAIKNKRGVTVVKTGHDEDVSFREIEKESFETRARKYHFNEECVTMFSGNKDINDEIVSDWIVQSWKDSPLHNKILTNPKCKQGAVSSKTVMIYKVPEKEKQYYLKNGFDKKNIVYFSSTFNCNY